MKQFSTVYEDAGQFDAWLDGLAHEAGNVSAPLFHFFSELWADDEIASAVAAIRARFPKALVAGASSYGGVRQGLFKKDSIIVAASFFERETSCVDVLSFSLEAESPQAMGRFLVEELSKRPWVAAVEVLVMKSDDPLDDFFAFVDEMPEEVIVFGGETHFGHSPDAARFVIGNDGAVMRHGGVFVLYGGPDLHFTTRHVQGWKPLGSELTATRYTDNLLHELDGKSAYDLYHRYLNIENDEEFFFNALEFPFLFSTDDGVGILRTPIACTEDGTIVLAASALPHARLHVTYGDPEEILKSVAECGREIAAFRPDGILLFSCGVRRTFWNDDGSNRESMAFEGLAPTSGFYTAGELLRVNGKMYEHNSTLIIAAAREGELEEKPPVEFRQPLERRRKSLLARFAYFIDAAMAELSEANDRLDVLSKTDELTGLLNRREIEHVIRRSCDGADDAPALIMIDLDDFKAVNDVFGHQEGDSALKRFAALAQAACEKAGKGVALGRWGGEEFIVFLPDADLERAADLAERVRADFERADMGAGYPHTASFGVIKVQHGESADSAISRADKAMYQAKAAGKNQVVAR